MKQVVNPFVFDVVEELAMKSPTITSWLTPSYSQRYEDVIVCGLLDAMSLKITQPAVFGYVEIGANHPISTSSTYLMKKRYGVTGILVEPNYHLAENLVKYRPSDTVIQAACVADPTISSVELTICQDENELSSTDPRFTDRFIKRGFGYTNVTVPAIHINQVLEMASTRYGLFYLSIDVEGPDVEILAAIDYELYRPCIIQIEASEAICPGNTLKMIDIMKAAGYVLIANTFINLIFIDGETL